MNTARPIAVTLTAMILTVGLGAQAKPDFSGTWVLVAPQPGAPSTLVIKQDATSVSETDGETADSHTVSVKLDGSETRTTMPAHTAPSGQPVFKNDEIVLLSTATWQGNTLVLATAGTYPSGLKRSVVRSWTLGGDNQLQVEVTMRSDNQEPRTIKAVYKKKA
jgi:hypothetical protein